MDPSDIRLRDPDCIVAHIIFLSCLIFHARPFAGTNFLLAALVKEVSKLTVKCDNMERRLGALESATASRDDPPPSQLELEFPIFNSMDQYLNIEIHTKDMVRKCIFLLFLGLSSPHFFSLLVSL